MAVAPESSFFQLRPPVQEDVPQMLDIFLARKHDTVLSHQEYEDGCIQFFRKDGNGERKFHELVRDASLILTTTLRRWP